MISESAHVSNVVSPASAGESGTFDFSSIDTLRSMLEGVRVPMLVVDAGFRSVPIEYANDAFRGVAGYAPGELVGQPLETLGGELTDRKAVAALRRQVRRGRCAYSRIIAYRKDAVPFQADWRVERAGAVLGHKHRYFCSLRNVRELSSYARGTGRAPREPIRTAMIIVNHDGWITRASCGAATLLRLDCEPLVGQHVRILDTHIRPRAGGTSIVGVVRSGDAWDGCIRTGDGRDLFVSVDRMGNEGVAIVVRDDSENRRIEALAESVNLMNHTGYVFAGIRHELGNPINSIKTGLSVMKSQDAHFDAGKRRQYYEGMLAEISRIEYLLKGLRAFNAHEDINMRPLVLSDFLDALWRVVQSEARTKGLELRRNIEDGLVLLTDERALYQALLNLVTNAMEALESTHAGWIELSAVPAGEFVTIEVRDNGPGMTEEELDRARRPFFTTKAGGTGLGLPITCRILARIGGNLELASRVGFGTTARIALPRAPA